MYSHLTVSSTATSATGLTGSATARQDGPFGAFAALLASFGGDRRTDNSPASSPADTTVSAPLAATAGTDAATTDATDAGTPPKLMKDLATALAELDKVQQAGGTPDQDLLKRVKKAVDAVASYLATQPQLAAAPGAPAGGSTPGGAAIDPTLDTSTKDGAATANALAAAKTALSGLDDKLQALSAASGKTDPDLAAKLAGLAKALDPATLSADTLTQLGLNSSAPSADASLATAINALAAKTTAVATRPQPALATPELKLPENSSLGSSDKTASDKTASTSGVTHTLTSAPLTPTAGKDGSTRSQSGNQGGSDKSADTKAAAAASDAKQAVQNAPASSSTDSPATASATSVAPVTAAAKLATTAYAATTPPAAINLPQLAYQVVRHVQEGSSHFNIRLDPADLGRVDVKMSVDASGGVTAQMTVDRPETLDLLKRDAAQLSQAFTQAGLDGSKTTMQFSLNQNPSRQDNPQTGNSSYASADADDTDTIGGAPAVSTLYRGTATAGGLNLFV